MEDVYLKNLDMAELIEKARGAVMARAAAVLSADPSYDLHYIVLDMPCSFYSLRTLRCGRAGTGPHMEVGVGAGAVRKAGR